MPKTTYIVPQVPGAKRTSERPYTFAVIGRRNLAREREALDNPSGIRQDRKNWEFSAAMAAGTVGLVPAITGWQWPLTQDDKDRYSKVLAEHPTADAYCAHVHARRLAAINEAGTGPHGELAVLQWSMSAENAVKGSRTSSRQEWYTDLQVVPCVPQEKKARAKKAAT